MKIIHPILAALTLVLVAACHDQPAEAPSPPAPSDAAVRRATEPLERQLQTERALRAQSDSHLVEEKTSRSRWQNTALLLVALAVAMLVVGAIAGSHASKESDEADAS